MSNNIHVMVDLETLGTDINSVITAIGAVKFDIENGEFLSEFYSPVCPKSCQEIGMVIDADTVMWWLHPDRREARDALMRDEHRNDIFNALTDFSIWYGGVDIAFGPMINPLPVWGNGCMFDNQILELAYKRVGQDCPWTYKENRDYRTLRNLLGAKYQQPEPVLAHHALEDARWQAQHLINICKHNGLVIG
jgi:exodeoxyribonuclease VIII